MQQWLIDNKIPLGAWIKQGVATLKQAQGFFDAVSFVLRYIVEGLTSLLLWAPVEIMVPLFCALAFWLRRSIALTLFIAAALLLIINLGFWKATMQTLSLVTWSTLVCMVVGVPFGIAAAHRPWLFNLVRPVLDLMQTLPTFVYLIPTLILFGLGVVPGLISTIIFALPAPIRLTQLGVSSVPKHLLEAGEAFGATKSQLLWKVELPYALPGIMAGVTQCIMLSLSMVVIAALVGADGLGVPVVRALNTVNIGMGFEAGLCIVLLAIMLDRVFKQAGASLGKR
jgi:glycine betaine/proline transport system permease protein